MNAKKLFLSVLLAILSFVGMANDSEALKLRFKKMFLDGQMEPWKMLVDSLRGANLTDQEHEILLYGEYGLIGYLIGKDDKKRARAELDYFEAHIAERLARQNESATLYAFKAASVGFNIGLQPWKAIYLGSANKDAVDKALLHRNDEPMPLYEWANSLYFRPSFVGGDKKKAAELFDRVLEIYRKKDPNQWMYLNTYAWLGQVLAKLGDKVAARKLYLEILKEYPNYGWVKNELLPDLDSEKKSFRFLELNFD